LVFACYTITSTNARMGSISVTFYDEKFPEDREEEEKLP
jgi:hypothetical protein